MRFGAMARPPPLGERAARQIMLFCICIMRRPPAPTVGCGGGKM
ncbi:MAG: hypothetical protein OT477_22780 [Chloroflexi bacterium]|nr:hypothetical protein [Chloroflexota bacterium]